MFKREGEEGMKLGNVLTWGDLEGVRREEWGEYDQNPLYVCMKFSKK